jgi:hypothetical protein
MTQKIYYEEEAISLVFRMALSYREEKGTPEEIFERHKKLIYDLLKDKRKDPPVIGWNEEGAKKICSNLTEPGKVFLKSLLAAGRPLLTKEIGEAFKRAGQKWQSDRILNGIVAGFSRRSKAYHLPPIWRCDEGEDKKWRYSIDEEAAPFIKKYL